MSRVPFGYSSDDGCYDIMLANPPLVGDDALATEVLEALKGTSRQRYAAACKLHEEFRTIFRGNQTLGPVYSIEGSGKEDTLIVALHLLPNFEAPARMVTFYPVGLGKRLRFMELWYSRDPRFSRIDPSQFINKYKIRIADDPEDLQLRAAIIEILRIRKAPEDGFFSYTTDAILR